MRRGWEFKRQGELLGTMPCFVNKLISWCTGMAIYKASSDIFAIVNPFEMNRVWRPGRKPYKNKGKQGFHRRLQQRSNLFSQMGKASLRTELHYKKTLIFIEGKTRQAKIITVGHPSALGRCKLFFNLSVHVVKHFSGLFTRVCCDVNREGRVLGVLEVSRSIGDGRFKRCGVSCVPDVMRCTLTDNDRYSISQSSLCFEHVCPR